MRTVLKEEAELVEVTLYLFIYNLTKLFINGNQNQVDI